MHTDLHTHTRGPHAQSASCPPAFTRIWLGESAVKVYTGRYFLCKLNKSWLFIRSDYGTWLSSAVKLKVKPAVAEIELHWVSNVKSEGSLTVIKRSSTAPSSRHALLELLASGTVKFLSCRLPTKVSFFFSFFLSFFFFLSQRHPLCWKHRQVCFKRGPRLWDPLLLWSEVSKH